ncbi:MAG TPA: hypothetical protein VMH38_09110 [Thermoplasmata archaeon]|nr:hypothetical protein [Thermoplasmata archaeon]
MLRFWLLGGRWPSAPWELLVTLGGALMGTAALFVILFPYWSKYPIEGSVELGIFVVAAGVLLAAGFARRRTELRAQRTPDGRPRIRPLQ